MKEYVQGRSFLAEEAIKHLLLYARLFLQKRCRALPAAIGPRKRQFTRSILQHKLIYRSLFI